MRFRRHSDGDRSRSVLGECIDGLHNRLGAGEALVRQRIHQTKQERTDLVGQGLQLSPAGWILRRQPIGRPSADQQTGHGSEGMEIHPRLTGVATLLGSRHPKAISTLQRGLAPELHAAELEQTRTPVVLAMHHRLEVEMAMHQSTAMQQGQHRKQLTQQLQHFGG